MSTFQTSPPHTPKDFPSRFSGHRLSTTAEEDNASTSNSASEQELFSSRIVALKEPKNSPPATPKSAHRFGFPDNSGIAQTQTSSTTSKPPATIQRRGFKGAHASFRLRMLQEQHGFEPKLLSEASSMPNSPPTRQKLPAKLERTLFTSSLRRRLEEENTETRPQKLSHLPAEVTEKLRKLINRPASHSRSHSAHSVHEGTPKRSLTPKLSTESPTESRGLESPSLPARRKFRQAHQSFRIRMLQEQYGVGFEPVFISKKRTPRQQTSGEFKGGDLNKYTARTYTIQNGNEIFGGFSQQNLIDRSVEEEENAKMEDEEKTKDG